MDKKYNHTKIEKKIQKYWKKNKTFKAYINYNKEKFYCLSMLPYPSGNLHIGHVRNYTIGDVIARYQRMLGKNVLHPIGWDAFGLPAEEAAQKNNLEPKVWTENNIKKMKKQLLALGYSYDWDREINTSDPQFYKWEQWFFIKLFKKKLVYKKKDIVNWCPNDNTVLANEQVINGKCWRCQTVVHLKKISQWFLKITHYVEELLSDLNKLKEWPKDVINMQKNWIGKSKGIQIKIKIYDKILNNYIYIYTTKPELIMGATFISISPMHQFSKEISKNNQKVKIFLTEYKKKICTNNIKKNKEIIGINTNKFAIHPISKKKIPIWISSLVKIEFGTGSIMSVPAHDNNDFIFAKKYNLKIKPVILQNIKNKNKQENIPMLETGILFNSGIQLNNMKSEQASLFIKKFLLAKNLAKKVTFYHLKDWSISRQRYWGTPIPIVTNKKGKIIPLNTKEIPVKLPKYKQFDNNINSSLFHNAKWKNIILNGEKVIRETDTFDTFIESSWYYIRYTNPEFKKGMVDPIASKYWLPVDQYIGGIEHANMHLLYFRFFHKLLRDCKLINSDEPVKNLICQGMVLSHAFYYINEKKKIVWVNAQKLKIKKDIKGNIQYGVTKKGQNIQYAGLMKMSKSKNNGIDPDIIISKYGADATRLFIMFAAPINNTLEWKEDGLKGTYKFLKKLWNFAYKYIENKNYNMLKKTYNSYTKEEKILQSKLHETIMKVSDDIERRKSFNTAISSLMILFNEINKFSVQTTKGHKILGKCLNKIIKMLYPFTPHFSTIIFNALNKNNFTKIENVTWPKYKKSKIIKKNFLIIQINGKVRDKINFKQNTIYSKIIEKIKKSEKIRKYIINKKIKKIIYIKNKVINFILK
ncbi:leucine--tRNA ligase [Buchnera aphidicola (Kurisakia onigurumii)]|uniref:leucine--tRNA ligase n=1 Tax=Buchnera aphidicola TaxID=9 RepID=UPI0031B7010C